MKNLIARIKDCEVALRVSDGVRVYVNGMEIVRCQAIHPNTANEYEYGIPFRNNPPERMRIAVTLPLELRPDTDGTPFKYVFSGMDVDIYEYRS